MTLIKITDATVEPITLAEAKTHLRVDGTDDDALISALITAARTTAENRLHSTLLQSTWRLTLDAFPLLFRLEMAPILGVDSIRYYDAAGVQQTLDDAAWRLSGHRIEPVDLWPVTQHRLGAVEVTYKAGYGTAADSVPAPVKAWIKLALGDMYANRERSAERPVVAQDFADGLLDGYKIWAV